MKSQTPYIAIYIFLFNISIGFKGPTQDQRLRDINILKYTQLKIRDLESTQTLEYGQVMNSEKLKTGQKEEEMAFIERG